MLTTELLLFAYRQGIFPMADDEGAIGWYSPIRRGIIPLDDRFHIPHGLRRTLKKSPFDISVNRDFEAVVRACATLHGKTWISEEIRQAYGQLHREGYAHCIEARLKGRLVGGLYGVQLGGAFFGESMFYRVADASKVALVALVERLRERGFILLDAQWATPHLARFGTIEVSQGHYLRILQKALSLRCEFNG